MMECPWNSLEYFLVEADRLSPISYAVVRTGFFYHSKMYLHPTHLCYEKQSKSQKKTDEREREKPYTGSMTPLLVCLSSAKQEFLVPMGF